MMTSSRNLSKHLKNCYPTKTNEEMSQHDSQFFGIKKKMINCFLFIFMHNFKPKKKRLVMTCGESLLEIRRFWV